MFRRIGAYVSGAHRTLLVFIHDLLMVPVAWLGAYWLRFNLGAIPAPYFDQALRMLPWVIAIQAVSFYQFGLYRGVWRFASLPDLVRIIKAVLIGTLVTMVVLFLIYRLDYAPRSLIALFPLFLLLLLSGPRLLYRWSKDHRLSVDSGTRVLIVGAGLAGAMLARDLTRKTDTYQPVGFVDDKKRRHGQEILGIPILGDCEQIPQLARSCDVDLIILAIPSASGDQMRRLVELCEASGVPFRTLPPLDLLMDGRVEINQLREVSLEDLLGRDPVTLDWDGIRDGAEGSSVDAGQRCRRVDRLRALSAARGRCAPRRLILFETTGSSISIAIEMRAPLDDPAPPPLSRHRAGRCDARAACG
jgi:FlaA1/EpsC-like NDP-sugar epimerase